MAKKRELSPNAAKKAKLLAEKREKEKKKRINKFKKIGVVAAIVAALGIIGVSALFAGDMFSSQDKYVGKILSITALSEKSETVANVKRLTYNDMLVVSSVQNGTYKTDDEVEQAAMEGAKEDNLSYDDVLTADGAGVDIDKVKARTEKYKLNQIQENLELTASATMMTAAAANGGNAIIVDPSQLSSGKYIGKFVVTAYCACTKCCGPNARGITASGKAPVANHTIAADKMFAFGTQLVVGNQVYTVEDRGGGIKGYRIDIYFNTHQEALNFGRRTMDVYAY